jgi:chemotaxis signal transduction protein
MPSLAAATEQDARVLAERAARLARPIPSGAPANAAASALEFVVAGQPCMLEVEWLREVAPLRGLTPVPLAPASLLGLQPWRGQMLPVLDLALLLGRPRADGDAARLLVILGGPQGALGLAVDEVRTLRAVAPGEAESRSLPLEGLRPGFVRGVLRGGQLLLAGDRLLALHYRAGA